MNLESVDKIPGQLNDRRTMLGELNWIFTAITDTIAWNSLPRDVFQRLFRQDLLVASLFRNFLLAERILKSYDCTPVSWPKLPPTSQVKNKHNLLLHNLCMFICSRKCNKFFIISAPDVVCLGFGFRYLSHNFSHFQNINSSKMTFRYLSLPTSGDLRRQRNFPEFPLF